MGWEGVGFYSFMLINFWFTRTEAIKAAKKAIIINKLGDISLTLAFVTIIIHFKSCNMVTIASLMSLISQSKINLLVMQINLVTFIAFLLFIAAIAKSSQIWLHEWLLDAMEGPTPVSALIHAATMVTAGVFLIIRFSFIFEYSPLMMSTLLIFGSLTTIFGCIIGAIQYDLKKIIAGSTCSQLGLMMCACATTQYSLAIFHLFTHGFFKALLFLAAGCIIHALQNEQDIRKMGGLAKPLPLSYISILIGSLALSGSPYTDGFFSKDLIVETSYVIISIQGTFFDCLDSLATITSTLYSIQLLYFLFLREYEGSKIILTKATDGPIFMMIPLIILNICSLFIGYMFGELFILRNFTLLNNNPIYYTITNKYFTDVEYTSQF